MKHARDDAGRPRHFSSPTEGGAARPTLGAPSQARADLLRLWRLFLPWRGWMAAGAAVALVALLANIGLLAVSGGFVASMALAGAAGVALDYFTPAALIRGFAIARTGGRYVERLLTHEATFRLLAALRVWFYDALEPLAPARLQELHAADLLSRIQADIDTLNQFYLRLLVPVVVGVAGALLSVCAMVLLSPRIALSTALLLATAGVLMPAWLRRRGEAPGRATLAMRTALRMDVADALAGAAELRVYGAEQRWRARIDAHSDALLLHQRRLSDLAGIGTGAVGLCANVAMWSALLMALPMVASATMAPARMATLALFALAAFESVAPLPLAFQSMGEMLAAARRIFELVDAPPAVAAPIRPAPLPATTDIRIDGVRFRYQPTTPWVFDGLTLHLRAGGRLALIGASGAGKSSLVQLLARFRDYEDGSIRIGGTDLHDLAPDDARALLSVVSQDAYLFNGTVLENLLMARPDASEQAVIDACRAAQIHDVIAAFPDGYASRVGEAGMRLSGGEARRLAIARALLKDAPILVLDEPTEGLDAPTARALEETLARAMRGRTVLLITHRPGMLGALVDDVAVLRAGRISPCDAADAPA